MPDGYELTAVVNGRNEFDDPARDFEAQIDAMEARLGCFDEGGLRCPGCSSSPIVYPFPVVL